MSWQVDRQHTQIWFAVRHLGVSLIRGNFRLTDAELDLDEAHPEASRLRARVDAGSIDTLDATRDGHLKSADFFDAANHPHIEFVTTQVRPTEGGKFEVSGDLTVRGVTRPIVLQGEYAGPVNDPISGKRKVGFLLSGDLAKDDFGLTWNVPMENSGFMLADRLQLTIDAQAIED